MLTYRIDLVPDDNGSFLVTVPALPEVTTFADTHSEALERASNAIEEALSARITSRQQIPEGDVLSNCIEGDSVVTVPPLQTLKVLLYRAAQEQHVTPAEFARRLKWHREQVDRLFRLDHNSRLDQLDAAFQTMGLCVEVKVVPNSIIETECR